jgi:uncharacterized protein (TIGR02301 family)
MLAFGPSLSRFWRCLVPSLGLASMLALAPVSPARAIDPLYEPEMERLSQIMGSLYFLQPLCQPSGQDWRVQMQALINADSPDDDRKQRLSGAFNTGYSAYSRNYRTCTDSAREALARLMVEAEKTARGIHARYAE